LSSSTELTRDTLFEGHLILYQPREGYRFSIDALLLAGFITLRPGEKALDLGAGCGVISLVLACRYPKSILAGLEIQTRLARCFARNIRENRLVQRVFPVLGDLRRPPFRPGAFDVVFTNPPFRSPRAGRLSPNEEERLARHEILASLEDVLKAARVLLRERGRFFIIYPAHRLATLMAKAKGFRLEPKRLQVVHSYPGDEGRLVLLEAVKGGGEELRVLPPFFIYQHPGGPYTSEAEKLFVLS